MSFKFRVYLVRHAETDWNRTRRLQGQSDVPLNETGLKQAMLLSKALKDVRFVKASSSDLQRAFKTAECILYHQSGEIVLERDESIRERYYLGESQDDIPETEKYLPSAETMLEFAARCLAWYTSSIENYMISTVKKDVHMKQPQNILVVSHGGWILTLLTALQANGTVICHEGVEIGYCLNTGVSVVEYVDIPSEGEGSLVGTLVQYSDVEHLIHENLIPLEVNADVLGDAWWQP